MRKLNDWVMGYLIVMGLILAIFLTLGAVAAFAQPMGDFAECMNPNTNIRQAKKQEDFVSARRFTPAEVKSIKTFIARSHYNVDVDLSTIDTVVVIYFKNVGVVLYGGGGKVCHYVASLPDMINGFLTEALGQGV